MTLSGYKTYKCTAAEVAALSDYHAAAREFGDYSIPVGRYRGQSTDGLLAPMICDISLSPQTGQTQESWSRIVIEEGV